MPEVSRIIYFICYIISSIKKKKKKGKKQERVTLTFASLSFESFSANTFHSIRHAGTRSSIVAWIWWAHPSCRTHSWMTFLKPTFYILLSLSLSLSLSLLPPPSLPPSPSSIPPLSLSLSLSPKKRERERETDSWRHTRGNVDDKYSMARIKVSSSGPSSAE